MKNQILEPEGWEAQWDKVFADKLSDSAAVVPSKKGRVILTFNDIAKEHIRALMRETHNRYAMLPLVRDTLVSEYRTLVAASKRLSAMDSSIEQVERDLSAVRRAKTNIQSMANKLTNILENTENSP